MVSAWCQTRILERDSHGGRRKEDAARELSRFLSSRSGQRSCFRSPRLRRPRSRSLRPDGELGPVGTTRRNAGGETLEELTLGGGAHPTIPKQGARCGHPGQLWP